jgi:predicted AAA+ superfamily ATPase
MDNLDLHSKVVTPQDLLNYLKYEFGYIENEQITLFLDEFQNIKNAGVFLKNLYDSHKNISLICSGSSSLEITKNSEYLTGRKILFDITPFHFSEYLTTRNFKHANTKIPLENFEQLQAFWNFYSTELNQFLEEYVTIG